MVWVELYYKSEQEYGENSIVSQYGIETTTETTLTQFFDAVYTAFKTDLTGTTASHLCAIHGDDNQEVRCTKNNYELKFQDLVRSKVIKVIAPPPQSAPATEGKHYTIYPSRPEIPQLNSFSKVNFQKLISPIDFQK
jgi:hypothetical protein